MSTRPTSRSSNRLGRALGANRRDWRRRVLRHHLPIAAGSALVLVLFMGLSPFATGSYSRLDMQAPSSLPTAMDSGDGGRQPARPSVGFELPSRVSISQLTVATGYVATGLLGLTLLIGPANLLLRRRNPVSSYLRRDVGAWTAIFSVAHVVLGLQLHGGRQLSGFLSYFTAPDGGVLLNSFGLGNWTGLAALVIVVGLLAISTDRSLRELKAKRWKSLQRLNYGLFALVALHAFFYGALLRVTSPFTLVLVFTVVMVLVGQLAGIWLWRHRRTSARSDLGGRKPASTTQ